MNRFIQELRRRGVFRVAGLYIGIAWIALEGADVLLPAFNPPPWLFRGLIFVAMAGFPVALVLSWVYEITERGIERDEIVQEEHIKPLLKRRQMDFIVMGVLIVALTFSVYLNLRTEPVPPEELEPVSVLIADFNNQTGDPVFDGALEQALSIGIEGAPFITAFRRDSALKIAGRLNQDTTNLDESVARLVSVREGIKVVLAGSIEPDQDGYFLSLKALDPPEGETVAEAEARAQNKLEVLQAVGSLAGQIREALGDASLDGGELAATETFTAASIEAAQDYTIAQELARSGQDEEAVFYYKRAIERDPNFGRAYSGWALSASKLGRGSETDELWDKTLTLLQGMTEREKYRTLGVYYATIARNYDKAIENYQTLVDLYPADGAGHNNLAVSYFLTLDFDKAREEGGRVLEIYPKSLLYRANYALYAMYAGDFETATTEAAEVIEQDPNYYKAYLPGAVAALAANDIATANAFYEKMGQAGPRGASLANIGLADMALYEERFDDAIRVLFDGIAADQISGNQRNLATKYLMLAEAYAAQGMHDESMEALRHGLELSRRTAHVVPAAGLYLSLGDAGGAVLIADELGQKLQPQRRAYAKMIAGQVALSRGNTAEAVDALRAALDLSDLWLVRYNLGIAYAEAEHHVEALSEFEICKRRIGEATAVFLDDVPSVRYSKPLEAWLTKEQEALGMTTDASD